MHESCDVIRSLQDLGVHVRIYKVQQLIKNFFDVADLVKVCHDQRMFRKEFLFLFLESLFEFVLDLLLFVLELLLKVKEPLVNIFHLLELKSFKLFLNLLQKL
jgi:hypothetical protein